MKKKIMGILVIGLFIGLLITTSITAKENSLSTIGPPFMDIWKPYPGYLYKNDGSGNYIKFFEKFGLSVVIGKSITIEVLNVFDESVPEDAKVTLLIDSCPVYTQNNLEDFTWKWDGNTFSTGFHVLSTWVEYEDFEGGVNRIVFVFKTG